MGEQRDDFTRGYACAIARIWRDNHDAQTVQELLKTFAADHRGLRIAFVENGVDYYDLQAIDAAVSSPYAYAAWWFGPKREERAARACRTCHGTRTTIRRSRSR